VLGCCIPERGPGNIDKTTAGGRSLPAPGGRLVGLN
jgi:hypothetical protein